MELIKILGITIFILILFGGISFQGWIELRDLNNAHDYHNLNKKRKRKVIFYLVVCCLMAAYLWYWFINENTNLFNFSEY